MDDMKSIALSSFVSLPGNEVDRTCRCQMPSLFQPMVVMALHSRHFPQQPVKEVKGLNQSFRVRFDS
jgi:hypothetical protein